MIDITIQIDENLLAKFKSICETMDIAVSDFFECIINNAVKDILDSIAQLLSKDVPGLQVGE